MHSGLATPATPSAEGRSGAFDQWRSGLNELARRPNVFCKIGGLGTTYWGFGLHERSRPPGHVELTAPWAPYVETVVEAFGASRCMVASNFANDGRSCGFVPLWNAIKAITRQYLPDERRLIHSATAETFYRIDASH